MNGFIATIITSGLIFTQLPSAIAGVPLGAIQLKNLVPGRYNVTFMGVSNMTVTLRTNGTITGSAKGAIDSGYWKLSGNEICIVWNKWLGGYAHCSGLISEAGHYQGSGFTITPI